MENIEKLLSEIIDQQSQILSTLTYHSKLLEDLYEEKDKKTNTIEEKKQEMAEHMLRVRGVLASACGQNKQAIKIFDDIFNAGMPKK